MLQQELQYMLTIAREKSISRAAEKIHITQPALSLYLSRLEKQLGTSLFDRKRMELTYAGQQYIKMALQIERLYRNFELDLCSISQQQAGILVIGTSPHIGSNILPYVLPIFKKVYPKIKIHLVEGRTDELEKKMSKNEVDLALIHLPFMDKQYPYEYIGKAPFVLAIKKGHPLLEKAYRKPDSDKLYLPLSVVDGQDFIMAFPQQGVRRITDKILTKAGIKPNIVMNTSSVETAVLLAGTGLGVYLMPEDYINLFNYGELEPVYCYFEDDCEAYWEFVIAHTHYDPNNLSGAEKLFIKLSKEAFFRK